MEAALNFSDNYDLGSYDDPMLENPAHGLEASIIVAIETYLFPMIMCVGIVGNLLAMPALYVISLRTWSTIFYLSLLSCVDLVILLIKCGNQWYLQMTMTDLSQAIINSSEVLCKTYLFAFNFIIHLSPWLMVAIAVEMAIATRWPHRIYIMCTIERASNVVMLLVIVIVCVDINYFWTWGVRPPLGCIYTEEFSTEFRDTIWPAMSNIIQFFMPLLLVSVSFLITAATMISRRSRDEKVIERELKKYFLELTTLRDFQIICLVLSVIFMCLTFFSMTISFVQFLEIKRYIILNEEEYLTFHKVTTLLSTIGMTLFALFFSLKIFLYASCSSTFRATIRHGFESLKRKIRRAMNPLPKPGHILRKRAEEERRRNQGMNEGQEADRMWHADVIQQPYHPDAGHTNSNFAPANYEDGYTDQAANSVIETNDPILIEERMYAKLHGTNV